MKQQHRLMSTSLFKINEIYGSIENFKEEIKEVNTSFNFKEVETVSNTKSFIEYIKHRGLNKISTGKIISMIISEYDSYSFKSA